MQVTREDLNPCTVRLEVVCSPEEVTQGFDKAYKQIAKHLRVPGFRPGNAPKKIVAQMAPKEEVLRLASDNIVRTTIQKAIKEQDLRLHDSPVVDLKELEEDPPACAYTAKVPLAPVVELGDYRGLEANRPRPVAGDEEIDRYLEEIQKRGSEQKPVTDRGIETGDVCLVNIKIDGESGDGRNFMTVAGRTFPTLDAVLEGMRVEEIKHAELEFPASFQEKDWAGKEHPVTVTIRSVSSVAAPAMDDEFARSIPKDFASLKSESLAELRAKIAKRIEVVKGEMADEFVEEQLLNALISSSKVIVPDTMWEGVANQRLHDIQQEVREAGGTMEDYAKERGMTLDELVQKWRDQAKLHVERAVVANHIFIREKMVLSNEDFTSTLVRMAREYGVDPATLFEFMKKNKNTTELQTRAIYRKVIEFLRDSAKITEVDEGAGAATAPAKPVKKSAPKAEAEAAPKPKKTKKATE